MAGGYIQFEGLGNCRLEVIGSFSNSGGGIDDFARYLGNTGGSRTGTRDKSYQLLAVATPPSVTPLGA
eukprot:3171918-Rhodomonas_salina.1